MTGIAEWNHDIPLAFKILISGNPNFCKSSIFKSNEVLAIYSDYEYGIKKLKEFFEKNSNVDLNNEFNRSLEFLCSPQNKGKYFVLECGELMDYHPSELQKKYDELIHEIKNIENSINEWRSKINGKYNYKFDVLSFLKSRKKIKPEEITKEFYSLGVGNWSNLLCYDPFPPKSAPIKHKYETENIIEFVATPEDQFCWFKRIIIDRQYQKAKLISKENFVFEVDLISENRDINDRINFLFNIYPKTSHELTHHFSLLKGYGEQKIWKLSSASMQDKYGKATLRTVDSMIEYAYIENTSG